VLVHSLLHVATAAKESASVADLVVCVDCCRDDRQRAPNPLFQISLILSWGSKPVSRTRLHCTLIISLPTRSIAEHWRLTPACSVGVSSLGCSVAPIRLNAASMRYFWNGWLKTSVAYIIVAGSSFDILLLANGPTRRAILFHAALGSVTNKSFCRAAVQPSQCRPRLQQCSSDD
jgi:hypothetical protein